jgi:hypothetical protein
VLAFQWIEGITFEALKRWLSLAVTARRCKDLEGPTMGANWSLGLSHTQVFRLSESSSNSREPNPQNPQGNSKSNATLGGELLYGFRLK